MGGDSYVTQKLRGEHVALHVDDRTKPQSAAYLLKHTPRRLASGFQDAVEGNSASARKRATPDDDDEAGDPAAERPATRVTNGSDETIDAPSSSWLHHVMHPYTEGKRRGRKKKAAATNSPANPTAEGAGDTPTNAARPTPSPTADLGPATEQLQEALLQSPRVSSMDRGARRLLVDDIMQLKAGDDVALVIPVDRKGESKRLIATRAKVKEAVKAHIGKNLSKLKRLSGKAKDKRFDEIVRGGAPPPEGWPGILRVCRYHHQLSAPRRIRPMGGFNGQ